MKKLSEDIREWCLELEDKDLVIFEEYRKTISRSEEESDEDLDDKFVEEDDGFPIKLKEMMMFHNGFNPTMAPEFNDPIKHFKLWTIHTKVTLTTQILSNIEKINGIETIEAISRYRARIGIGPLFKDNIVMSTIKKIIEDSTKSDIKKSLPKIKD